MKSTIALPYTLTAYTHTTQQFRKTEMNFSVPKIGQKVDSPGLLTWEPSHLDLGSFLCTICPSFWSFLLVQQGCLSAAI
jgi:hypothetical protein